MELAVEDRDRHVDDGEAERPAVVHGLDHALLDRGDELAGDGAADDLVDELEALAPAPGRHPQEAHAELAAPARLLLVLALGLGGALDRLPVGHLHVVGVDADAELALQAVERGAHDGSRPGPTARSGGSGRCARGAATCPRRAGGRSAFDSLSSSAWVRAWMATGSVGGGTWMRGTVTGLPLGASVSLVCTSFSLATATRSPRGGLGRGRLLGALERQQRVEAHVAAAAAVDEVVVGLDRAGHDLDQRELADVAVGDGLEHERQRVAVGVGRDAHRLAAGHDRDRRPGRAARGRPRRPGRAAGRRRCPWWPSRRRPGRRSAWATPLPSALASCSGEGTSPSRYFSSSSSSVETMPSTRLSRTDSSWAASSSGIGTSVGGGALVGVGLVGEQVGDPAERRLGADRQLQGHDARAEALLGLGQGGVEVRPLPVHLVDEDGPGDAAAPPPSSR